MKKFTKLFLSCAAVAAITAAVATSAMAAGDATKMTANWENDALTVTATYDAAQKTLLVLPAKVTLDNVTDAQIIQIDQRAAADFASGYAVPLPSLEDGDYMVYMGGDGEVYSAKFHVGDGSTRLLGDVVEDNVIDTEDAAAIVQHFLGNDTLTGDDLKAAKVLGNAEAETDDAAEIVQYFLGNGSEILDSQPTI